jgi:hypothetical protein
LRDFRLKNCSHGQAPGACDEDGELFSRVHCLYGEPVTKLLSVRIKNHIQIDPVAFVYSKKLIENGTKYQL